MACANIAHCRDLTCSSHAGNSMDKSRQMVSSHPGSSAGITQNPVSLCMGAPAWVELPHPLTQSSIVPPAQQCSSHQEVPDVALRPGCATINPGKPWTTLQETWPHLPLARPASHQLHPPQQPRCPAKGNDQRAQPHTEAPAPTAHPPILVRVQGGGMGRVVWPVPLGSRCCGCVSTRDHS